MGQTRLYLGTGRSARARVVDDLFQAHWGRAFLVLPTRAAAESRRAGLMRAAGRGLWGNPVCDFHGLVSALLSAEGVAPRLVGDTERRRLVEGCLRSALAAGAWPDCRLSEDSPGVARHLTQVIAQLKQAAVEPEDFVARVAGTADAPWMDRLVAAVYAGYQEALKSAGAFDVPGLYWEAEARCRAGRPALLADCEALLFDGFDDFTPSEFRLIAALRPHAALLAFGVHYDPAPARQDLFRAAGRTVARIRARFEPVVAEAEAEPPRGAAARLADGLFSRESAPLPPTPDTACNVSLLRCGDGQHEALAIARRVKAALRDGALAPGDIAVAHADPAAMIAPMTAAFARCGVPLHPRAGGSLAEGPAGGVLLRLLRALQRWERDAVLDALCGAPFAPADPALAAAFPYLARHAAVVSGRSAWARGLKSLRAVAPEGRTGQTLRLRLPDPAAAVDALDAALARLGAVADALPAAGPPAAHADALESALLRLDAPGRVDDAAGWQGLWEVLGALRRAPGASWEAAHFARELALALREAWGPVAKTPGGVVFCGPADLRNQSFRWVFLAGLNEGVFPRQPGANAIYNEEDRARLARAGIHLDSARDRLDKERLLFHHAVAAARDALVLSHPLLKPDHREAAPSPFVADVLALLPGLPATTEDPEAALAPRAEAVASEADWVNAALWRRGAWQGAAAARFSHAARAAAIEARRHAAAAVDAHDGALDAPAALADLAVRFGADHEFSVRRVEAYVACPFDFFQTHVLDIEEAAAPEAEFDPRVRGTILHDALEAFHRGYRGRALPEIPEAEAEAAMREALAAAFESVAWRSAAAPPGLREGERRHLEAQLARYLQLLRRDDEEAWKPMHFEVAFGHAHGETPDPLCRPEPMVIETAAGPVRFAGRIDRVDLSEAAARIVDYKSGGVPAAADVHAGRSLQCTVYAWALEQLLLPERRCLAGLFIPVGRRAGSRPWFDALGGDATRDKEQWARREDTARERIAEAVAGMRAGRFSPPVDNAACHGCKGARACRHETGRLARKAGTEAG